MQRAESTIQANGARAAGRAPPPAAANKRKASPVRQQSPVRPRPDGSKVPKEGGEEGEEGEPVEEGPKQALTDAPLSAAEKLRQALAETHAKLDDKKGLHWLASHAPEWPKQGLPGPVNLRARMHALSSKVRAQPP